MQHNCGLNITVCGQTLGANLALSLITCVNLLTTYVFNLLVENSFCFISFLFFCEDLMGLHT